MEPMRSSRLALRAPATPRRLTRARTAPVSAAPDACAKSAVPRGCGMNPPGGPCRSGTFVPATRARRAAASAGWSSRRTTFGTARPARLGKSGTPLAARGRDRSRCRVRSRSDVAELSEHRTGRALCWHRPAATRVSPCNSSHGWNQASVHFPSTSSTSAALRRPRPYTPLYRRLQGFSVRSWASVDARDALDLPW
jgi:hypothetical protein